MPVEQQFEKENLNQPNQEQTEPKAQQIHSSADVIGADCAEFESQLEELNAKFRIIGEEAAADHCYFLGIALGLAALLALLGWYALLNNGLLLPAILAVAVSLICSVAGIASAVTGLRISKMRCSSKPVCKIMR